MRELIYFELPKCTITESFFHTVKAEQQMPKYFSNFFNEVVSFLSHADLTFHKIIDGDSILFGNDSKTHISIYL